jgi:hypothetical protein
MSDTFSPEQAQEILLPDAYPVIEIGGRKVEIRPLSVYGSKAVFAFFRNLITPYQQGSQSYAEARDAFFLSMGEDRKRPDPLWFFDIFQKNLDDVVDLVHIILQRGDRTITLDFVKEHLEPLTHLPFIFDSVVKTNQLEALLKKATSTEMGRSILRGLASRLPSGSTASASTSASTTDTASETLPDETASGASSSSSSSETESPETST